MTNYYLYNGKWGFSAEGPFSVSNCDPNSSSVPGTGTGCSTRLIRDGKMNY